MQAETVDFEGLVLSLIESWLPEITTGTIRTSPMPLPFAQVRRINGSSVDPRFIDRATIDIQNWADTRRAALRHAATIRSVILTAWDDQVMTPHGNISWYEEVQAPQELRDEFQSDNVWRFQATYRLTGRGAP